WLTVDCVRWTRSPARVKPPASTTETKLRRRSMSSIRVPFMFPLDHMISFNFQIASPAPKPLRKGALHACRPPARRRPVRQDPAAGAGRGVLPDLELGLRGLPARNARLPAAAAPRVALRHGGRHHAGGGADFSPRAALHAPRSRDLRGARHRQLHALS